MILMQFFLQNKVNLIHEKERKGGDWMGDFRKNLTLLLLMLYQARVDELEKENKKNKAHIAMLEGFIDGKRFNC